MEIRVVVQQSQPNSPVVDLGQEYSKLRVCCLNLRGLSLEIKTSQDGNKFVSSGVILSISNRSRIIEIPTTRWLMLVATTAQHGDITVFIKGV